MKAEQVADLDRITLYKPPGRRTPRPIGASGLVVSDLYRRSLIDDRDVDKLSVVAQCVEAGVPFCDDDSLLDAWLDTFELLSSVHDVDVPSSPSAQAR